MHTALMILITSNLLCMLTCLHVSEPNGRVQSIIQDDYHISVVSEFLCNSISQQERSTRRENFVFAPCRLFPGI